MSRSLGILLTTVVVAVALPITLDAQADSLKPQQARTRAEVAVDRYCDDATTLCVAAEGRRKLLNGIRFVFEPQVGVLIQNGRNRFDETSFKALEKIGLATDFRGDRLGLQVLFIYPSTVTFDEQSPLRVNDQLTDTAEGKVDVNWGYTVGLTMFDGILSVGGGFLYYDPRDFVAGADIRSNTRDSFFYVNFQPVEAIKEAIQKLRPE